MFFVNYKFTVLMYNIYCSPNLLLNFQLALLTKFVVSGSAHISSSVIWWSNNDDFLPLRHMERMGKEREYNDTS